LIYFYLGLDILPKDSSADELPRDTSQKLTLFVYAMSFIKPLQHQIRGINANLQRCQACLHFMELLSSLRLPYLTYLELQFNTKGLNSTLELPHPQPSFSPGTNNKTTP